VKSVTKGMFDCRLILCSWSWRPLQEPFDHGGPHLLQLPGGEGNGVLGFTQSKELLRKSGMLFIWL